MFFPSIDFFFKGKPVAPIHSISSLPQNVCVWKAEIKFEYVHSRKQYESDPEGFSSDNRMLDRRGLGSR